MEQNRENLSKNSRSFNLLRRDIIVRQEVKQAINWYKLLNLFVVILFTTLGVSAYLLGMYLDTDLEARKTEILNYANKYVYTAEGESLKSRVSILNDRYALYENIRDKNVNIAQVINDIQSLSSGMQIKRIDLNYGKDSFLVELIIPDNAYDGVTDLFHSLRNSTAFENFRVKSVLFTIIDNRSAAEIQLELSLKDV
ncbi:MAG: hypothetical protein KatS3mg084_0197 [Candidatus Dojkabacteria bacterium]|nr:MAG: hypothetical protein KatS3mg084_0197 [Candidatus Dojkabacteria bacterium]